MKQTLQFDVDFATKRTFWQFVFIPALYALLILGIFFAVLNTCGSDYSWGDVAWFHQRLFNFWHHRFFQTSLYRIPSSGELASPFGYAHDYTIHVTLTHYFLALPYIFLPRLNTLYALAVFLNVASLYLYCLFVKEEVEPGTAELPSRVRWSAGLGVAALFLSWGTYYQIITYKCHPMIFATPLFLLSYIWVKKDRYALFFLAAVGLMLIQEDSCLWMSSYALYLILFEKKKHAATYATAFLGIALFAVISIWLQKDAKWYLPHMRYRSDIAMSWHMLMADKMHSPFLLLGFAVKNLWKTFLPLSYMGVILYLLIRVVPIRLKEAAHLILVPAPHWLCFMMGRGSWHHYIPVLCSTIIVLTSISLRIVRRLPKFTLTWPLNSWRTIGAGSALLLTFSVCNYAPALNAYILLRSYNLISSPVYNTTKMDSDRDTVKIIQDTVPASASLCFWTARGVTAFITNRSDIWRFPYAFDQADYLVIQKNVDDGFFQINQNLNALNKKELSASNYDTGAMTENKSCSSLESCVISPEDVAFFKTEMVDKQKTHNVYFENNELLILKSKTHRAIYRPPFTESLYWR